MKEYTPIIILHFLMKHLANHTSVCRKTLRNAGLRTDSACSDIKGDGSQKAEELARTVSKTIDDCTKCRRKHSHQKPNDHHTGAVIARTQKILREELPKIESIAQDENRIE